MSIGLGYHEVMHPIRLKYWQKVLRFCLTSMRYHISWNKLIYFVLLMTPVFLAGCKPLQETKTSDEYVLALPAVSGGGGVLGDPYPEPGPDLSQYYGMPPPAILQVGQLEQVAALGATCWIQEVQAELPVESCLDSPGIPTPQTFLPVDLQFSGTLRLPLPIVPAGVAVFHTPVSPADILQPPADGLILWPYREGHITYLSNQVEQDFQLELSPGLNVLYIDARWEGLGSAGYGFLVEARIP